MPRYLRLGYTLAAALLVAGSLLTFPAGVPVMVAIWLAASTAALGLIAVLSAVAMLLAAGPPSRNSRRLNPASGLLIWIAWAAMARDWHLASHTSQVADVSRDRPIVCLGDSLTSGLPSVGGYPRMLKEMVTAPVIDRGQAGITTQEGLRMIPEIVRMRPQFVVVELGGHDFLKGHSRAATKTNLVEIVSACQKAGAEVVLFEIPRGFIIDPFSGLEREIARQYDLQLIPDTAVRQLVLFSPHCPPGIWLPRSAHMSDDGLHPNARLLLAWWRIAWRNCSPKDYRTLLPFPFPVSHIAIQYIMHRSVFGCLRRSAVPDHRTTRFTKRGVAIS